MEIIQFPIDPDEFKIIFTIKGEKISVRLYKDMIEIEGTANLGIKADKSDNKIGKLLWIGIKEK